MQLHYCRIDSNAANGPPVWQTLTPDERGYWLPSVEAEFESFLPLLDESGGVALFETWDLGIEPSEWSGGDLASVEAAARSGLREQTSKENFPDKALLLEDLKERKEWNPLALRKVYIRPFFYEYRYCPLQPEPAGTEEERNACLLVARRGKSFWALLADAPASRGFLNRFWQLPRFKADGSDNLNSLALERVRSEYARRLGTEKLFECAERLRNAGAFLPALAQGAAHLCLEIERTSEWTTSRAEHLQTLCAQLLQKSILLGRGAREKKRLFETFQSRADDLSAALTRTFMEQQERLRLLAMTGDDLFYYVYATLSDPDYARRYAEQLKTRPPRLPLYDDFWLRSALGRVLAEGERNVLKAWSRCAAPSENCLPQALDWQERADAPRLCQWTWEGKPVLYWAAPAYVPERSRAWDDLLLYALSRSKPDPYENLWAEKEADSEAPIL